MGRKRKQPSGKLILKDETATHGNSESTKKIQLYIEDNETLLFEVEDTYDDAYRYTNSKDKSYKMKIGINKLIQLIKENGDMLE